MNLQSRPATPGGQRSPGRRAAFVDRDGVLNADHGYVHRIEDFVVIPGALAALRALHEQGFLLVLITNQSGIARGLYSEEDYRRLMDSVQEIAHAAGFGFDAIEYCPHLPDAPLERFRLECECRKPRPGMILRAAAALAIDLPGSILIGDRESDIAAGRAAGVGCCYLVKTGMQLTPEVTALADAVFDDIGACVRHVLAHVGGSK